MRITARHISAGLASAALSIVIVGCQPAGPGVQVTVRAEPKQGYSLPPEDDVGYGTVTTSPTGETHDHAYHLIDYRKLEGIVVWVEPIGGAGVASTSPPGTEVDLDATAPARLEDVYVTSVGGAVTFIGQSTAGVLRTSDGQIIDLPRPGQTFVASAAGLVEVLRDDSDEPAARIYISPTPWVKKARNGQKVTFSPLPPGSYRVTTWHPLLPGNSQIIDVVPDKLTGLTLTVGVNSLPKPNR